eukprot:6539342-Pyramimonas_sp.AAC.6
MGKRNSHPTPIASHRQMWNRRLPTRREESVCEPRTPCCWIRRAGIDPTATGCAGRASLVDPTAQFSRGEDIERFLRPPARLLDTSILGGSPFFTSVPSGRVGHTRDCMFHSDEHFRAAVWEQVKPGTLHVPLGQTLPRGNVGAGGE